MFIQQQGQNSYSNLKAFFDEIEHNYIQQAYLDEINRYLTQLPAEHPYFKQFWSLTKRFCTQKTIQLFQEKQPYEINIFIGQLINLQNIMNQKLQVTSTPIVIELCYDITSFINIAKQTYYAQIQVIESNKNIQNLNTQLQELNDTFTQNQKVIHGLQQNADGDKKIMHELQQQLSKFNEKVKRINSQHDNEYNSLEEKYKQRKHAHKQDVNVLSTNLRKIQAQNDELKMNLNNLNQKHQIQIEKYQQKQQSLDQSNRRYLKAKQDLQSVTQKLRIATKRLNQSNAREDQLKQSLAQQVVKSRRQWQVQLQRQQTLQKMKQKTSLQMQSLIQKKNYEIKQKQAYFKDQQSQFRQIISGQQKTNKSLELINKELRHEKEDVLNKNKVLIMQIEDKKQIIDSLQKQFKFKIQIQAQQKSKLIKQMQDQSLRNKNEYISLQQQLNAKNAEIIQNKEEQHKFRQNIKVTIQTQLTHNIQIKNKKQKISKQLEQKIKQNQQIKVYLDKKTQKLQKQRGKNIILQDQLNKFNVNRDLAEISKQQIRKLELILQKTNTESSQLKKQYTKLSMKITNLEVKNGYLIRRMQELQRIIEHDAQQTQHKLKFGKKKILQIKRNIKKNQIQIQRTQQKSQAVKNLTELHVKNMRTTIQKINSSLKNTKADGKQLAQQFDNIKAKTLKIGDNYKKVNNRIGKLINLVGMHTEHQMDLLSNINQRVQKLQNVDNYQQQVDKTLDKFADMW